MAASKRPSCWDKALRQAACHDLHRFRRQIAMNLKRKCHEPIIGGSKDPKVILLSSRRCNDAGGLTSFVKPIAESCVSCDANRAL